MTDKTTDQPTGRHYEKNNDRMGDGGTYAGDFGQRQCGHFAR